MAAAAPLHFYGPREGGRKGGSEWLVLVHIYCATAVMVTRWGMVAWALLLSSGFHPDLIFGRDALRCCVAIAIPFCCLITSAIFFAPFGGKIDAFSYRQKQKASHLRTDGG